MERDQIEAEISQAISQAPDMLLAATRSNLSLAAAAAEQTAAKYGHSVSVRTSVYLNDGSHTWPTTLAHMVCETPSVARGKNADIARVLTTRLEMDKPFRPATLSKPLSEAAKKLVRPILAEYGYETSSLTTGTDIVRIVRDNVRTGAVVPQTITTKFYADHIELDGRSFMYRQRERVPTGDAWHDFSLRLTVGVAGVDVPLIAVLKLRNMSLGEFIQADKTALATATPEEAARRKSIDREALPHPGLSRLLQADHVVSDDVAEDACAKWIAYTGAVGQAMRMAVAMAD